MTDDIVTRLREKYSGQLPICAEAADEIEQLRADRDRWHKIANELHLWLMPDFEDDEVGNAGVYAMQMYEQAVRGE